MKVAYRSLLISLTLFCVVLMFGLLIIHAQEAPQSPQHQATYQQKLAFVSTQNRQAQIYTVAVGSGEPVNVSKNAFSDIDPAWSPDGLHLAFASNRDGNNEICVMDADGSNQHCLTNNATTDKKINIKLPEDRSPVWSPDNQRIAFVSSQTGRLQIFVINTDGSNPLNVSNTPYNNSQPAWSPDLKQIAFVSDRDGNREVCVMDASGFNQRCLTNNRTPDRKPKATKPEDTSPSWSPDSQKLAFVSTRSQNRTPQIFVMNVDGSNVQNVTKKISVDDQPAWSPDGMHLAFVSNREGTHAIFIMKADGSGQARLVKLLKSDDTEPVFALGSLTSPDGKPTQTLTPTPTGTIRFTDQPTDTPTMTRVYIAFVPSITPFRTITPLPTNPPPQPPVATPVPPNPTPIPLTATPSVMPTTVFTPPSTVTPSIVPTVTSSATSTNTPTVVPTATLVPTITRTPTPTATFTATLCGMVDLGTATYNNTYTLNPTCQTQRFHFSPPAGTHAFDFDAQVKGLFGNLFYLQLRDASGTLLQTARNSDGPNSRAILWNSTLSGNYLLDVVPISAVSPKIDLTLYGDGTQFRGYPVLFFDTKGGTQEAYCDVTYWHYYVVPPTDAADYVKVNKISGNIDNFTVTVFKNGSQIGAATTTNGSAEVKLVNDVVTGSEYREVRIAFTNGQCGSYTAVLSTNP